MGITAKLGTRKKGEDFSVYPRGTGNDEHIVVVQSDRTIGAFNELTGLGFLNDRGSGFKGFIHLNPALGARPYQFPQDFVEQCASKQLKSGDKIGAGVYVA